MIEHQKPIIYLQQLTLLCLVFSLISCGFHLRGSHRDHSPLPPIKFTYSLPLEWQRNLEDFLTSTGVRVSEEGQYHVSVSELKESRRVASLNSRAKAAEYEVYFSFDYQIFDNAGRALVKSNTIQASRTYQFIESQVVGKEQEEQILKSQIQKLLFQKLVRHIRQIHRLHHAT